MSKDKILQQASEVDIIRHYFPSFKNTPGNFKNPLAAKDNNPSLNWYQEAGNWRFKAHNTGEQGDVFQFVAYLYKLDCKTQFAEVCKNVVADLGLNISLSSPASIDKKVFELTFLTQFTKSFLEFWEKWNVDKVTLEHYQVRQVATLKTNKGTFDYTAGVVSVFTANGRYKVYVPLHQDNERWTRDKKTGQHSKKLYKNQVNTDIFGAGLIRSGQDVFICEGEKDTLVLAAAGYNAICFQSATIRPTQEQIKTIKENAKDVFVCYDMDKPGRDAATWLQSHYQLYDIRLPDEYKDMAEYFQIVSKVDFDGLVDQARKAEKDKKAEPEWNPDQEESIFHKAERYLGRIYDLRMNAVKLRLEFRDKGSQTWEEANEHDFYIEMRKAGVKISINDLKSLLRSNFIRKYNPVHEYFSTLSTWDETTDHIQALAGHVNALDPEFNLHFKKWLVRAVKCAIEKDYFNKNALVFIGKQNDGKTTFCRFLCPKPLNDYIIEHITDDKDGRLSIATNFIINIDELANLNRNDTDKLKSLMSLSQINERLPYDSRNTVLPRIASFIGSTNNKEFLGDGTGNVRWLCFEIAGIDFTYSQQVDINAVWSQAYHLFKNGYVCEITREEMIANEKRNSEFTLLSQEAELIQEYFKIPGPHETDQVERLSATLILERISMFSHTRLNSVKVGKAMQQLGFEKVKISHGGNWGYLVIQFRHEAAHVQIESVSHYQGTF